ncbi:MAG: cardiolipin synthase [Bacteroidales bacterium]|nr:cardiolipin synthase [Bacteroidales bacterium]
MNAKKLPDNLMERWSSLARCLSRATEENRLTEDNSFEIITSGLRKRELLLEDIRRARSFIHLEYYRFGNDKAGREVRDLLQQKAAEGVEVRFLNNNMSCLFSIPASYFKGMVRHGIEVIPFTGIRHGLWKCLYRINHQQHRKIVIIDGTVAYTGGMNLNDNYFYKWRDTHLRMTGPVVTALNASFIESWKDSGGRMAYPPQHYFPAAVPEPDAPFVGKTVQLVMDSPLTEESSMLCVYECILHNAREYVYLQTPYFAPPVSLLEAIKDTARRGVDVRIMLPKSMDTPFMASANRAYYAELMEAGVKLGERGGAFIHCKTLVADDEIAIIGASNLDYRSFHLNFESNVLIYDRETALACKEIFHADQDKVKELDLKEWQAGRNFFQTAYSRFLRLFYRML